MTAHLQAVTDDGHVRVVYSAEPVTEAMLAPEPTGAEHEAQLASIRRANYGVSDVERLAGNVGYLDPRWFIPPDLGDGAAVIAAAMTVLAHTDALVIDLRQNRGGSPEMVRLLASYLLGPEPVRLTSIYYPPTGRTCTRRLPPSTGLATAPTARSTS